MPQQHRSAPPGYAPYPSVCAGHGKISMSCRLPIPLVLAGRYLCIGVRCIAFLHPGLLRAAPAPHVHEPAGYGGSSAGIPAGPILTPGERTPSRKALPMNTCGLLHVMKCFTFIRCRKNSCWSSCRRRITTVLRRNARRTMRCSKRWQSPRDYKSLKRLGFLDTTLPGAGCLLKISPFVPLA